MALHGPQKLAFTALKETYRAKRRELLNQIAFMDAAWSACVMDIGVGSPADHDRNIDTLQQMMKRHLT